MSLYADPLFIEAELAWRRQRDSVHTGGSRCRHGPHLPSWLGGRRPAHRRAGRTTARPA